MIGFVLIAIVTFAFVLNGTEMAPTKENTDELCSLKPIEIYHMPKPMSNFTSADWTAMAKFDGHLIYHQTNNYINVFQNLNLTQIELDGSSQIKLVTPCAKISLNLKPAGEDTVVDEIKVDLQLPNGQFDSCRVPETESEWIRFGPERHYSCGVHTPYECSSKDADGNELIIATLVINFMEFEVNGDPKMIANGRFSKAAISC